MVGVGKEGQAEIYYVKLPACGNGRILRFAE